MAHCSELYDQIARSKGPFAEPGRREPEVISKGEAVTLLGLRETSAKKDWLPNLHAKRARKTETCPLTRTPSAAYGTCARYRTQPSRRAEGILQRMLAPSPPLLDPV